MLEETNSKFSWKKIGCYDTPPSLSENLSDLIFEHASELPNQINALDLFSGDGRLGLELVRKANSINHNVGLTFLEIDKSRYKRKNLNGYKVINGNAFTQTFMKKFDIVISNPPFLSLTEASAKKFGIAWEDAKTAGKNLYTCGILKALEFCKSPGVCAIIAPFGWVQGYTASTFRSKIEILCDKVIVHANPERNLFRNVNQDIALQLFFKRKKNMKIARTETLFKYNGYKFQNKQLTKILPNFQTKISNISVNVGNIVWNREKDKLSSKSPQAIPLIYGKNIQNGKLDFHIPELANRQYAKLDKINKDHLIKAPAIVLRRTLRGRPGNWTIDSAIINNNRQRYVAENHVIIIRFFSKSLPNLEEFRDALIKALKKHYYYSGSPCMSTTAVRQIAQAIKC